MKKIRLFFTALMLLVAASAFAQNITVSGNVVDAFTGEPVAFASIQLKGTMTGSTTDADGKYSISVPKDGALIFSSIGYHSVEIPVQGRSMIDVSLETDAEMLNETIVVAFGQTTKEAFTGSASVVKSDDLAKRQTSNVANALVGSVAGLQIRGNSGAPGSSGGSINIRGIASMYASTDPLIIVDGAPYSASLTNIPQSDIESVTVLKDAASAALYGARGAAGVILVTTKKGRAGKATVNVDMKWGVNSRAVQDYDIITDPGEYYEAYYSQLYNMYYYGQGLDASTADQKANDTMLSDLQYNVFSYPDGENLIVNRKLNPNATPGRKVTFNGEDLWMQADNWNDEAYKTSLRQEYTVSVTGSTGKMNYYMSVGYLNEDGIVDYSDYQRTTARLKVDYQARKWLKVGANVGYINSKQNLNYGAGTSLSSTNLFYFTSGMAPIYPIYVRTIGADGNPVIKTDSNGNPSYDYGIAAKSYGVTRPFLAQGNPLGSNRYNEYKTTGNQLNGTFDAEVKFCDFLKANVTSTVIWGGTNLSDFGNMLYGPSAASNGNIGKSNTTSIRTNNVQTLTYFDSFGLHNVNVMAGHEYYTSKAQYLYGHAVGMFSNDIKEINAAATKDDAGSYTSFYNVEGYFLSAQYDYAQRYFLSASYRRDASSYFAKENRWGDFWSVGGAWIISKEKFMGRTTGWLDMLKLKASVGQQGNDGLTGAYYYTDTYNVIKATENSMSVSFRNRGNKDITWETTTNTNVGLEFSFFKGRLSGSIDYYNKKTSDLLFWMSIPESSGSRGMYGNVGDIRNQGVELALNATLVRTNLVDWSVYGNISHNKTRILSLPESKIAENGGFEESNGQVPMWYRVGGPLYNAYLPSYAGVDEYGQALFYIDTKDEDGNTIVKGGTTYEFNDATKYETGTLLPKVFGGFGTTLKVGGFDLSVTFDYQIGGKVYDFRYMSLIGAAENSGDAGRAIHKDYLKSWSVNNTDSQMPRWQYGDKYGAAKSDRFLTDASYLDFQSFTVGYTFPEKWFKNKCKIRIYAIGENLWFWSARKGLDPRYAYQGTSSSGVNSYSPIRTISGGLQFSF